MARCEDSGFPVRGSSVCSGRFVGLLLVSNLDGYTENGKIVFTGGSSSSFSPRSGFAFRFAKTPSFECEKEERGAPAVGGLTGTLESSRDIAPGNCEISVDRFGLSPSWTGPCSVSGRVVLVRIKR